MYVVVVITAIGVGRHGQESLSQLKIVIKIPQSDSGPADNIQIFNLRASFSLVFYQIDFKSCSSVKFKFFCAKLSVILST